MGDYFSKSKYWRIRAEASRSIAAGIASDTNRTALLRVADEYDKIAERIAREEKIEARAQRVSDQAASAEHVAELKRKWQGD